MARHLTAQCCRQGLTPPPPPYPPPCPPYHAFTPCASHAVSRHVRAPWGRPHLPRGCSRKDAAQIRSGAVGVRGARRPCGVEREGSGCTVLFCSPAALIHLHHKDIGIGKGQCWVAGGRGVGVERVKVVGQTAPRNGSALFPPLPLVDHTIQHGARGACDCGAAYADPEVPRRGTVWVATGEGTEPNLPPTSVDWWLACCCRGAQCGRDLYGRPAARETAGSRPRAAVA